MTKTILRRAVSLVALGLLAVSEALCQCPALTGTGNFASGITVVVSGGPDDPNLGPVPVAAAIAGLNAWSAAMGSGINFVLVQWGGGLQDKLTSTQVGPAEVQQ